jgi:hypothetical protein
MRERLWWGLWVAVMGVFEGVSRVEEWLHGR